MTASDILYIATTVAFTQALCDILANKLVYEKESYKSCLFALERAHIKREKALIPSAISSLTEKNLNSKSHSSAKAQEKWKRKVQQAEEDYGMACTNVAKKHTLPQVLTSVTFLMLYRILSLEYKDRIIGLLPIEPWGIVSRLTRRGFSSIPSTSLLADMSSSGYVFSSSRITTPHQICGFFFIYMLCTLSIKVMVHKLLGTKPPVGADKGFMTSMLDDPRAKNVLTSMGVDMKEIDELRKNL